MTNLRRTAGCFTSVLVLAFLGLGSKAFAQAPPAALELSIGYAGFADNATIAHFLIGGAARFPVTPRLAIGPEFVYLIGPKSDRDIIITGNLTFDLVPAGRTSRAVTPYVVVGGGLFRHSDRFGAGTFSSSEGAFTGGAGARVRLGDRVYVAPELRFGWELHTRVSATLGYQLER